MNWGIQGKHYEIKDGKRVIPAEVQDQKQTMLLLSRGSLALTI